MVKLLVFVSFLLAIDHAVATWLTKGMTKYFRLDKAAAVLCVGNSHTRDGVDEELLEEKLEVPVTKYALRGNNTFDRLAMIRQFVFEHPKSLRLVIYDVDDHTFTSTRHDSKTYTNLYPFLGNPEIKSYVRQSAGTWEEYVSRECLWMLRYPPDLRNMALTQNKGTYRKDTVSIAEINRNISREGNEYGAVKFDPDNIRCLEDTIRFVRSQGAIMVFLYIPVTDLWNAVVDKEKHQQAVERFRQYALGDRNVLFLNYKKKFEHRYDLFYDRAHMNIKGKEQLTKTLLDDIRPLVYQPY